MKKIEPKAYMRAILRTDFRAFSRRAVETLIGKPRSDDPYLEVLWFDAEKVARGEKKRVIVNLPPRHAKTYWLPPA